MYLRLRRDYSHTHVKYAICRLLSEEPNSAPEAKRLSMSSRELHSSSREMTVLTACIYYGDCGIKNPPHYR